MGEVKWTTIWVTLSVSRRSKCAHTLIDYYELTTAHSAYTTKKHTQTTTKDNMLTTLTLVSIQLLAYCDKPCTYTPYLNYYQHMSARATLHQWKKKWELLFLLHIFNIHILSWANWVNFERFFLHSISHNLRSLSLSPFSRQHWKYTKIGIFYLCNK